MQNPQLNVMRILWLAILLTQGVFFVVARYCAPHPVATTSMLPIFAFVSALVGAASFVVPRVLYRGAALKKSLDVEPAFGPAQPTFDPALRSAPAHSMAFVDAVEARRAAYQCAMAPFIIALALSESVGLYGFAAAWTGVPHAHTAPFFAAAVALIALRFPTDARVIADFEAVRGARIVERSTATAR